MADDKWCKCWLVTTQIVGHMTEAGVVGRAASETRRLVELANVNPVGLDNSWLPGDIAIPPVDFFCSAAEGPLFALIEIRFDVQLEGDADIWFRNVGGSQAESPPGPGNAVRVREERPWAVIKLT
jgi:hypothetical protein